MLKYLRKLIGFLHFKKRVDDNSLECYIRLARGDKPKAIKCTATGRTTGLGLEVAVKTDGMFRNYIRIVLADDCPDKSRFWELYKKFNKEAEHYTWEDGTPFNL